MRDIRRAFVAAPAVRAVMSESRVAFHRDAFIAALRFTQAEAVRRGVPVSIGANVGPNGRGDGWQIWEDADGNGALDADEPVIRVQAALQGTALADVQSPSVVTFASSGFVAAATNTVRTFRVCAADRAADPRGFEVRLSITGKTRSQPVTCSWSRAEPWPPA